MKSERKNGSKKKHNTEPSASPQIAIVLFKGLTLDPITPTNGKHKNIKTTQIDRKDRQKDRQEDRQKKSHEPRASRTRFLFPAREREEESREKREPHDKEREERDREREERSREKRERREET